MLSNNVVEISISTTVQVSSAVALDILNVAANGGCDEWAEVSKRRNGVGKERYLLVGATFTTRQAPTRSITITANDVCLGMQKALADSRAVSQKVKSKILRVIADNNTTDVDMEVASCVIRALME